MLNSALIGVGVNADGHREVLGVTIGNSESEATWSEYLSWLKGRGLHGVDLVVSDDHGGLANAVQRHSQGVSWQRCQVYFMRNILDVCPKRLQQRSGPETRSTSERYRVETVFTETDLASHLTQISTNLLGSEPRDLQRR